MASTSGVWTGLIYDVEFNMVAVHPFRAPDCSGNHENDCGLRLEASHEGTYFMPENSPTFKLA